jgi:hypothetical protein
MGASLPVIAISPAVSPAQHLDESQPNQAGGDPALVTLAREIKSRGGRVSLRQVAVELASKGFTTPSGAAYSASAVASMLD